MKEERGKRLALDGAKSLVMGLVLSVVLLLVLAMAISGGGLSQNLISGGSWAAGAAGALLSGFSMARRMGARALVTGFMTGLIFFAVLFLLGIVFLFRLAPMQNPLPILLCSLLGGTLGGLLGASRRKKRHIHK